MAKYKLLLPKMGESVAEATVIRWTKNPGDYIDTDETVMEIATDKVDSDVPSPVSGKLIEQLYKENDVVQVGAALAIIETDEPDEEPQPQSQSAPEAPKPTEQPIADRETVASAPISEPHVEKAVDTQTSNDQAATEEPVEKPEDTTNTAPVYNDQKHDYTAAVPFADQLNPGNPIAKDDGSRNSGRFYSPLVKNIAAQEGISSEELDKVPGTGAEGRLTKDDLLNYLQNRQFKASPSPEPEANASSAPEITVEQPASTEEQPVPTKQEPAPIHSSASEQPAAQQPIAEETQQQTTEAYRAPLTSAQPAHKEVAQPEPQIQQQAPAAPIPQAGVRNPGPPKPGPVESKPSASVSGGDEIIEMDRMRRLIADHMVMSMQTSPHVTSFVEADVTNLVLWREKIKGAFEKREGEKITFTPLFIEAVVKAIKDMPMINVSVNGTQIIKKKDINISMAAALPSGNLIVPVIKRADELSLIGLTKAVNDLANRARAGKLKPDDTQGGTFTITNVGSFGNVMGTPIINQPEVAILAVGAIKKKPAVIETLQGDMIGIRHMMFLSLSYDHRVVDGALGGSFVRRIADYLENWDTSREI